MICPLAGTARSVGCRANERTRLGSVYHALLGAHRDPLSPRHPRRLHQPLGLVAMVSGRLGTSEPPTLGAEEPDVDTSELRDGIST